MIQILVTNTEKKVLWDKPHNVPVQFVAKETGTWVMVNKVVLHGLVAAQLQQEFSSVVTSIPLLHLVVEPPQEASLLRTLQLVLQRRPKI